MTYPQTTGQIAAALGISRDRVQYILAAYGIQPTTIAGHARLYDDAKIEQLRQIIASRQRRDRATVRAAIGNVIASM